MYKHIFEDEYILVVNKEPGLVVHPGAGNADGTLLDMLLASNNYNYLGIINRIDKDTSGLVLMAKNGFVHFDLEEKMKLYEIERKYVGFVYGAFRLSAGKIETNIIRSSSDRTLMTASSSGGKKAITLYNVIGSFFEEISLVGYKLRTGRTHQIRVHMKHNKTPIIGDLKYSKGLSFKLNNTPGLVKELLSSIKRPMLHSAHLSFEHPVTNKKIIIDTELPEDMSILYKHLAANIL